MDTNTSLEDLFFFDPNDAPKDSGDAPTQESSDISTQTPPQDEPTADEPSAAAPPDTGEENETLDPTPEAQAYFEFLQHYDILRTPDDFTFDGSPEKLQEALDITKTQLYEEVAETLWNNLPENFKPLLEYGLAGGTSIEEFKETFSSANTTFDLTNEQDQEEVMRRYYKLTSSYSPERIEKLIQRLRNDDDLELEAKETYVELQQLYADKQKEVLEAAATKKAAEQKLQQDRTNALSNAISSSEFIHPSRRNNVRAFFFNPIKVNNQVTTGFNSAISSILSNPEHQAQFADLLLDYDPKKGFSTERLEKKVKTKATQTFQQLLQEKLDPKSKASSTTPRSTKSNFDLDTF